MASRPPSLPHAAETLVTPDVAVQVSRLVDTELAEPQRHDALARLFAVYRESLLRMVEFRLHPLVRPRIDPWDVLQESFLDASQRIGHFQAFRGSFLKWLRLIVLQRIHWLHRHHLSARMRDAALDVSLEGDWLADGDHLAECLAGSLTSPSHAVQRNELIHVVNEVLAGLKPIDREVLVLRHFEHLDNSQVAEVLDISPIAASVRYSRALTRLTAAMSRLVPVVQ
ncbi:MAG: sigma-70 family RNA polymerase sigma factor [Planctomycetaceae bacterium]|nr:sigma-70 family RNA polymerase sigma factor [Planctomycetaceae bacterium]